MRIKLTVCLGALIMFFAASAQNKIKFNSINMVGIAFGENENVGLLQTINGIRAKNFFTGIGVGIDYYRYKTLPLFFDERVYFGKKNNAFAYVDFGYNFPLKNKPGKEFSYYQSYKFSGGIYTDFGIGCKIKFIKKSSLVFTTGYNYKEISDRIGAIGPADGIDYNTYNYGFGRIVLKAGVDF